MVSVWLPPLKVIRGLPKPESTMVVSPYTAPKGPFGDPDGTLSVEGDLHPSPYHALERDLGCDIPPLDHNGGHADQ